MAGHAGRLLRPRSGAGVCNGSSDCCAAMAMHQPIATNAWTWPGETKRQRLVLGSLLATFKLLLKTLRALSWDVIRKLSKHRIMLVQLHLAQRW